MLWRCRLPSDRHRIVKSAPNVEGLVVKTTQASPDSRALVEISIGADDGLTEGHELAIHRKIATGNEEITVKPLGKIHLRLVMPGSAIGIVSILHEGAEIKKGDSVTSTPQ